MTKDTVKFGYNSWVGMDFSKSMNNPNSRTMKILKYLNTHSCASKDALVYNALGRKTPYGRGYAGVYFALLRKTGLVTLTRYKNDYVYTITDFGRKFVGENAPTVEPSREPYYVYKYPNGFDAPPERTLIIPRHMKVK